MTSVLLDVMSRYRKNRARRIDYDPLEEEQVSKKWRVSRSSVIGAGVVASLLLVFVLSYQFNSFSTHEVTTRAYDPQWASKRTSWKGSSLSSKDLKTVSRIIDIGKIYKHLDSILKIRVPGTKGHRQVAQYIYEEMYKLGWVVQVDRFQDQPPWPYNITTFTNIIATLNPSATRKLVLACHYDSKVTPIGFLGATDSAVPCSMMLEIAHALQPYLKEHSVKNAHDLTLQLIFFDGEEAFVDWTSKDSLYGSRHLAELWKNTTFRGKTLIDAMDLMILLDLIGTDSTVFRDLRRTPTSWYKAAAIIERNMKRLQLLSSTSTTRFRPEAIYSMIEDDHVPFMNHGVPILHLISAPFPKVWHTLGDNLDALDRNTIHDITKVVTALVAKYLKLFD